MMSVLVYDVIIRPVMLETGVQLLAEQLMKCIMYHNSKRQSSQWTDQQTQYSR